VGKEVWLGTHQLSQLIATRQGAAVQLKGDKFVFPVSFPVICNAIESRGLPVTSIVLNYVSV